MNTRRSKLTLRILLYNRSINVAMTSIMDDFLSHFCLNILIPNEYYNSTSIYSAWECPYCESPLVVKNRALGKLSAYVTKCYQPSRRVLEHSIQLPIFYVKTMQFGRLSTVTRHCVAAVQDLVTLPTSSNFIHRLVLCGIYCMSLDLVYMQYLQTIN